MTQHTIKPDNYITSSEAFTNKLRMQAFMNGFGPWMEARGWEHYGFERFSTYQQPERYEYKVEALTDFSTKPLEDSHAIERMVDNMVNYLNLLAVEVISVTLIERELVKMLHVHVKMKSR